MCVDSLAVILGMNVFSMDKSLGTLSRAAMAKHAASRGVY
jgi:hypothetical protein